MLLVRHHATRAEPHHDYLVLSAVHFELIVSSIQFGIYCIVNTWNWRD